MMYFGGQTKKKITKTKTIKHYFQTENQDLVYLPGGGGFLSSILMAFWLPYPEEDPELLLLPSSANWKGKW